MKIIPEFPQYTIDELGRVYSYYTHKYRRPYISNNRYCFKLRKDGISYTHTRARLLARVYLDLPSLGADLEVDHKDTNTLNDSLGNLQVLSKELHRTKTILERGQVPLTDKICMKCSSVLNKNTQGQICSNCLNKTNKIDIVELITLVCKTSWVNASKVYKISDNGLRKFYKRETGLNPSYIKQDNAGIV